MRRLSSAPLLLLLLAGCGGGGTAGTGDDGALVVMTRNLYLGAPLEPLQQVAGLSQLPAAVGATWRTVQASDVPGRMERVVDEIVAARADVVALQEAALFEVRPLLSTGPATEVLDFLQLLLDGLHGRGHDYVAAGTSTNAEVELPDDSGQLVHFADRDAVLVRSGVRVSAVTSGRYSTLAEVPAGLFAATIPRGWLRLELTVEGRTLALVATHLEIETFRAVQEAQAQELVRLLPPLGDLLVAGDFNSAADGSTTASYGILAGAGLEDPWTALRPGDPGFTCCFAGDLRSPAAALTARIDLVLRRGALTPSAVELVGATPASITAGGLHASDHAGVVTTFPGGP